MFKLFSAFQEVERKFLYMLSLISMIVFFAFLNFILSPLFFENVSNEQRTSLSVFQLTEKPEKFDFPYAELTIPYLRSRAYVSSLSELEKKSETTTYTNFLTSYDSDGLEIFGQLTIPKGEQPSSGWSAIVFVHGYIPPSQYRTFEKYVAYVDYLARNGFVVFKIDLRGHGESEGNPGGAYFSSDYIIDVLHAYSALENSDFVDPKKIGLWGHSMAGNVLLRTVAVKPDIPAAVIWAGAGFTYDDFFEYRIQDGSYQRPTSGSQRSKERAKFFDTVGEYDGEDEFWGQVSPVRYLPEIQTAIELHHASNDSVVTIEYSRNLAVELEKAEVDHQLFEYSSGGHNVSGASFNQAMERTVGFFQLKLGQVSVK